MRFSIINEIVNDNPYLGKSSMWYDKNEGCFMKVVPLGATILHYQPADFDNPALLSWDGDPGTWVPVTTLADYRKFRRGV